MTDDQGGTDAGAELRARLDVATDDELVGVSTPTAEQLTATTVPLRDLFPTLASRHYLNMPTAMLPPRMHRPFGRRSWRELMDLSPAELLQIGRIDPASVGALLVSLRTETGTVEAARSAN